MRISVSLNKNTQQYILILFCICNIGFSQNLSWHWANSAGGTDHDAPSKICTDKEGNVIVAGNFTSPTITFGDTTHFRGYGQSVFVVKYSPSGAILWSKSAGNSLQDQIIDVAVDLKGNILVTGMFANASISFGSIVLISKGKGDLFLVKFSPEGTEVWGKVIGANQQQELGTAVCVDSTGSVYVAGVFHSNSINISGVILVRAGGSGNGFIVKYDKEGVFLWVRALTAPGAGVGIRDMCSDQNGNLIVTGVGGFFTIGTDTVNKSGEYRFFLIKFLTNGTFVWSKSDGIAYSDSRSVSTDNIGDIYLAGYAQGTVVSIASSTLTLAGANDIFLAKYSSTGQALWAVSVGGSANDYGLSCSVDENGNVLIAGIFYSSVLSTGATTIANTNAGTNNANSDVVLLKYSSAGILQWSRGIGGSGSESYVSACIDTKGSILVTGSFASPSINFGTNTLYNSNTPIVSNIFVAKLGDILSGVQNRKRPPERINIYPNPFTNEFRVRVKPEVKILQIKAFDVLGREQQILMTKEGSELIIQIENKNKGIYILQITDDQLQVFTEKILMD